MFYLNATSKGPSTVCYTDAMNRSRLITAGCIDVLRRWTING